MISALDAMARPLLHLLSPETAHRAAIISLKLANRLPMRAALETTSYV